MRDLRFVADASDPDSNARTGAIHLPRGVIQTPAFMPVGTQGTVKALSPAEVRRSGADILLGNTYHLYLRPGEEVLERFGGLHGWMGWEGPILTDSGGYQFFSLRENVRFADEGVAFQSHHDGSRHRFTPERVMDIQRCIGSDIRMVLDQCVALPADRALLREAMDRSTAWALRSLAHTQDWKGATFAIVQGGTEVDLRVGHLETLAAHPFDGIALGGLAVGEEAERMYEVLHAIVPRMPADRPRYLMGVGTPADLLEGIASGLDMFDCVMPTRNARTGTVFTSRGRINLRNGKHRFDDAPLDDDCVCEACQGYSRSYLSHLIRQRELFGLRLATLHNLTYYQKLMREAREAIRKGCFTAYRREVEARWAQG